jgi:polygalacturonase
MPTQNGKTVAERVADVGDSREEIERVLSDGVESVSIEVLNSAVYNVLEYGANGDGVGDDKDAIQAAVDDAYAAGGGTVFLPPGTYQVKGTQSDGPLIGWESKTGSVPIEFRGAGWGSEIFLADDTTATDEGAIILKPGENAEVHSLAINGNVQNQSTPSDARDGANIKSGANVTVHHVKSYNATGDGAEARADGYVVHDNLFIDNFEQDVHFWGSDSVAHDNICIGNKNDGAIRHYNDGNKGLGTAQNVDIHDNLVINPATTGIELENAQGVEPEGFSIHDNIVRGASEWGIHVSRGYDIEIVDNRVFDSALTGIRIESNPAADITVRGNRVQGSGEQGIQADGVSGLVIEDNRLKENQKNGIHVFAGDEGLTDLTIKDNRVFDNNQANGSYRGIYVVTSDYAFDDVDVIGNKIKSTATPYHNFALGLKVTATGSFSNVTVEDNEMRNWQTFYFEGRGNLSLVHDNYPTIAVDVRNLDTRRGNRAYHDGSGSNTEGEAQYIDGSWTSLVDGTTIA